MRKIIEDLSNEVGISPRSIGDAYEWHMRNYAKKIREIDYNSLDNLVEEIRMSPLFSLTFSKRYYNVSKVFMRMWLDRRLHAERNALGYKFEGVYNEEWIKDNVL